MTQPATQGESELEPTISIPFPEPDPPTEESNGVDPNEAEDRRWLAVIFRLLESRRVEPDANDRVQKALDRLYITAADRGSRILRSDVVDH